MRIHHLSIVLVWLLILTACTMTVVPPTPTTPLATTLSTCSPTPGHVVSVPSRGGDELPSTLTLPRPDEPGERLVVTGTVYASDCQRPLAGAYLEVWQTNAEGEYTYLEGKLQSDAQGRFTIETIKPGSYGFPAHIHMIVYHADAPPLETELQFVGDPLLPESPSGVAITTLVPGEENGESLLRAHFDIILNTADSLP